jgi:hypothetical protein
MLSERKQAFDTICRVLAITKLDIEHHQYVNDQSLNIHGEAYFKDLFNFIYKKDFETTNFGEFNAPFIDLIDLNKKEIIQITTTRTKDKILHSLKALKLDKYSGYTISIYYLLGKAMPTPETAREIETLYGVILKDILKDSSDLIRAIETLETNQLIKLCDLYFKKNEEKYTDKKVLNLVFKKLLKEKKTSPEPFYNDDFGSIETNEKILLNKLNDRTKSHIQRGLDYVSIVEGFDEGSLSDELRELIVEDIYRNILIKSLLLKIPKSDLINLNISELHKAALDLNLDFNKTITLLHSKIENLVIIKDFNSMDISWILIAYFFETCDIGVKEIDSTNKIN